MPPGGFVAGLIIPHENGFAISLVEKLEDLVNILFIPIVRPKGFFCGCSLILVVVLHTFWLENRSISLEHWDCRGIYRCPLLGFFLCKVYPVLRSRLVYWFQLARSWRYRCFDELQGVCKTVW